MRVLITGRQGQVGFELERAFRNQAEVVALDRQTLDLSRPETIAARVGAVRPDVILNAAAYTAVDRAESDEEVATLVNGAAVAELAAASRRRGTSSSPRPAGGLRMRPPIG